MITQILLGETPKPYKYPELKERIQNLRQQQTKMPSSPVNHPPVTAKAHSQVISRLKKRIHQLEEENKELKTSITPLSNQDDKEVMKPDILLASHEYQYQAKELLLLDFRGQFRLKTIFDSHSHKNKLSILIIFLCFI